MFVQNFYQHATHRKTYLQTLSFRSHLGDHSELPFKLYRPGTIVPVSHCFWKFQSDNRPNTCSLLWIFLSGVWQWIWIIDIDLDIDKDISRDRKWNFWDFPEKFQVWQQMPNNACFDCWHFSNDIFLLTLKTNQVMSGWIDETCKSDETFESGKSGETCKSDESGEFGESERNSYLWTGKSPPPWSLINFAPLLITSLQLSTQWKSKPPKFIWSVTVSILMFLAFSSKLWFYLMTMCCSGGKGFFEVWLLRLGIP